MKRRLTYALVLALSLVSAAGAQHLFSDRVQRALERTFDALGRVSVLTFGQRSAPNLADVGEVVLYADSTADTLKMSIDGGAYADLVTSATAGGVTGTGVDNRVMRWNGTTAAQSSGVTLDDLNNMSGLATVTATSVVSALTGNASTATALAADPADCALNQFANAVAASGALTCAAIIDADVPNTITIDLAATATALAANGANCAAGQAPLGVDASGAAESCATVIGGSAGATDNRLLRSDGTGGATVQNSPVTVTDAGAVSGVTSWTGTGDVEANDGAAAPANNVLLSAHTHSGLDGGGTRLVAKDRRHTQCWFKDSVDAAAADATSERTVFTAPDALTVTGALIEPAAALTANDTNFASIILDVRSATGTAGGNVATFETTTTGTGSWVAHSTEDAGTITTSAIALNEKITVEITKSGTGVVVPVSTVCIEYTIN